MLLVRRAALSALALVALFLAFVYAPIPGLAEPGRSVFGAASEAQALAFFDRIEASRDLARPFPAMRARAENPQSPERVTLGRLLFFDPVLSGDDSLSCAHCHHPDLGFSDGRPRAMGFGGEGVGPARAGGAELPRAAPSLWNAAYNATQFWDGRAADLEEQAAGPIRHPDEMGQDPDELVAELRAIPEYVALFAAAFGGEGEAAVAFERVAFALAAFERTLLANDTPFDRCAAGDPAALSPAERRGLSLFRSLKTRCFECHAPPTFANPDFKVIGVPEPEGASEPDLGRAAVAGPGHERAFKVPTLRNVALTAPYMHNGAFATLEEVLAFYAGGGGRGEGLDLPNLDDKIRTFELRSGERDDLIAFLHALSDESARPAVPERVPSGLPVVPALARTAALQRPSGGAVQAPALRDPEPLVVHPGESIQAAVDAAAPGDVVRVLPGTYRETVALDVSGVTLRGVEVDGRRPVLDGGGELPDAVIGSGSDLTLEGFDVRGYTANGVMIDTATNATFRDLAVADTGLYGIYPVACVGVLVERCDVTGARDAGIYVGQSKGVIVRGNAVHGNVTGIEIENSVDALVEDNDVFDNAGGILVFLLPNNPSKLSRRCTLRGNRVHDNNGENFADPGAIVASVPSGTGVLILAGDEVEVTGNEIRGNRTCGVAVLGLESALGAGKAFDVDPLPEGCRVHRNSLADNGTDPDPKALALGLDGADLVWDLSGSNNSWDETDITSLPPSLPEQGWSDLRRRANRRLWLLAAKLR